LRFVIAEGERQYVRRVLLSGLESSDPELVYERIRNLEPGDPVSQASMIENQRRLYDLGIFARVDTALQNAEGEEQYKYILYRFEEASKYSLTGGIGAQIGRIGRGSITSFESPGGSAGFSPRISLGVSRSNFLGIGHTVSLQTRFSNIQRRVVTTYLAPQFKGNPDVSLTFNAIYDDSRDVNTFKAQRQEAVAQINQRLSRANTIQYRLGYRKISVDNLRIDPDLIPIFSRPVRLGVVSGTFIEDRRDDPADATKGIYNTADVALGSDIFRTRATFTRALGRNATYHRVGRDMVFARSLSLGAINSLVEDFVPLPERFFAGGASSHRGFPDNQAGPRDLTTGFPLGGKALVINTLELRFPLIGDNVGGVLFHDAGNVFSDLDKISFRVNQRDQQDFDYMVHALGFGVRYRTPIGPVRLDLAYSINPPRFFGLKGNLQDLLEGRGEATNQQISHFQFHFSLGQAF
ncbi:MAG: BamA/OMP85 family outer membrane protein, partial [Bryobacteraceae bacterium]